MKSKTRRIVILGGCGYIGSQLFTYLLQKGFIVDTVDYEMFGNYINPKNIKKDYATLPKSFFGKYDVVILLAGHSTVGMCDRDIVGSLKNNIASFVDLMTKLDKQKFIYASTYRLYSAIHKRKAKETDRIESLQAIYDLTKQTIDKYITFRDIEFYSLRMATVNGFSPNLRLNQVINKIVYNSLIGRETEVYNTSTIFSVLGIMDLCRAIEKIVTSSDKRGIYNLGSFETSINDIIKVVSKSLPKTKIKKNPSTQKSIHMLIDTSKFQKKFNYKFLESCESVTESIVENFSKKMHTLKSY